MLKFLFWIFIIIFIIRWSFKMFGGLILRALQKTMLEKMKDDMERQTRDYERNFDREPFRENIYQNQDLKVSADKNRNETKTKPKVADFAEDVDFEEV